MGGPKLRGRGVALIGLFVVLALFAGNWPVKNIYHGVDRGMILAFEPGLSWQVSKFLIPGHSDDSQMSVPYVALVRAVHRLFPDRLRAARVASVLVSALALLYKITASVFNETVGHLTLLLAATSPMMIETLRSFGFIPLSGLLVLVIIHASMRLSAGGRPLSLRMIVGMLSLVASCVALWSLHVVARAAVVIPALIFLFSGRRDPWASLKLALFVSAFAGLLFLAYNVSSPQEQGVEELLFVSPEWYASREVGPVLLARLGQNVPWGMRYLTNTYRPPPEHSTHPIRARFFNIVWTPFFFFGLGTMVRCRPQGTLGLLSALAVLFLLPLASSGAHVRRMVYSLYPIYAILGHGVFMAHRWYKRCLAPRLHPRLAASLPVIYLLGVVLADTYAYQFQVSRPVGNEYTDQQLRVFARVLLDEGEKAAFVLFTKERDAENLFYGNPYVANDDRVFELLPKLWGVADPRGFTDDPILFWELRYGHTRALSRGFLLIDRVAGPEEEAAERRFIADYQRWYPNGFRHARIEGTDIHYYFLPGPGPEAL